MANLQAVTGRHRWMRLRQRTSTGERPIWTCTNCHLEAPGEDPDRPVTGCLTDIDVRRVGTARQKDYLEDDTRRRQAAHAHDQRVAGMAAPTFEPGARLTRDQLEAVKEEWARQADSLES